MYSMDMFHLWQHKPPFPQDKLIPTVNKRDQLGSTHNMW